MIKYKNFNIYNEGNTLVVFNTDTKEIKRKVVVSDYEFIFNVMKSKIKARDGIDGLLKFIQHCIDEDFGIGWVNTIIKGM